ncbi:MAG: hypothetical protein AB9846_02355 [Tenuifilaceae bacterium]
MLSLQVHADNNEIIKANNRIPYFNINQAKFGADTTTHNQLDLDQIADSLTQKVLGENKIVDQLDPSKIYTLPIGIGKNIGGIYYIVVLDDLRFTPTGLTAKAYMSLLFPGSSKKIGLMADNVKIGIGGIQAAQLKMLKDNLINLPGANDLLINADSTFVEWDCNGYKITQLSAKLFLDDNIFYKENPTNRTIIKGEKVKGNILCTVVDFNDILLSVTLDPFQVKGLNDFSFYPKEIILDLSDTRNAASMQFPSGFQSALFDGSNKFLWRGLYLSSFTLKFPKSFAKNGSPPEISASKFLIDFEGITGTLSLNYQLISLEQGDIGGWKFSINSLLLSLNKNDIAGFGMKGGIVLPITEQNKPISYTAIIDADRNFLFQVTIPDTLKVPMFGNGSSLRINTNSKITISSKNGEFYPKAELHGIMNVGVSGATGASLADITFQGLTIQREEPQLDIQSLSMQSGMMSGFPVQINRIEVVKDIPKKAIGLLFEVSANLMEGKIQGATSFIVWATRKSGNWQYKDLELRSILIDADTGPLILKGQLNIFKKDPVYGTGYFGSVNMSITPGIAVAATAQFGNVSDYRYWYADASLAVSTGISIFPGFAIYGFGGGAYYHMQRNTPTNILMETKIDTSKTPKPGKTRSGIGYTPNRNIALGLKAKVIIGTQPSPSAFNGSVTFELAFTESMGLQSFGFLGDGRFMTEITKDGADSKIKAKVDIVYLSETRTLSGNVEAYINAGNAIKGNGANNLAGRVDFFFTEKKWHIYVGTPTSPINVMLMNKLSASSYFMVGNELPDFPTLPENVAELSKSINFTNMRSESLAKSGGGFAFGASIMASTGEEKFLIFYGNFTLGAGFDLMLKNLGNDARCEGFNGPLGINGWYAQGQAWAYVNANIGVNVKVFKKPRKFNIMNAGFAAALGAQLPNPTYLAGAVEAHFSVLGGLVKGNCHFEFDYGTQCKLTNTSAVEGINVIAEVTPSEGGGDVDVFLTPQVAFNMPINEEFKILDDDGKEKSFRVALDYFKILNNGLEIPSAPEWNPNKDVLALKPFEVLPGQKNLQAKVKIHFQTKEGSGDWIDYAVAGNIEVEERNFTFTTGVAPDFITQNNVDYTYPVRNMVNFYKNEYENSYIQLKQDINYLFTKPGNWIYLARFKSGENTLNMPIAYNGATKRVELNVPANLLNNSIYQMRILRLPSNASTLVIDANVVKKEELISDDQTVTTKEIDGILSEEGLTELYSLHFRTSNYNSFIDKMSSLSVTYSRLSISNFVKQLHINFKGAEPVFELFDSWEIENIKILALTDQTPWIANNYKNLIYQRYPLANGMEIDYRQTNTIGVPPVWVSNLAQYSEVPSLNQDAIARNLLLFNSQKSTRVEYNLCYYVTKDWVELRNKSFYVDALNKNPELTLIKNSSYTGIYSSTIYPVKLMYYVPGKSTPTSEYTKPIYY